MGFGKRLCRPFSKFVADLVLWHAKASLAVVGDKSSCLHWALALQWSSVPGQALKMTAGNTTTCSTTRVSERRKAVSDCVALCLDLQIAMRALSQGMRGAAFHNRNPACMCLGNAAKGVRRQHRQLRCTVEPLELFKQCQKIHQFATIRSAVAGATPKDPGAFVPAGTNWSPNGMRLVTSDNDAENEKPGGSLVRSESSPDEAL